MFIKGHELDIDILEELEGFDFKRARIRGNKLQACSPLRDEGNPSFAINLDNGLWVDSGAPSEEYRKGNFIKLLSFLRQEDYEEIESYLIQKYNTILADVDKLELKLALTLNSPKQSYLSKDMLLRLKQPTTYFTNRGISLEVQEMFNLGYNPRGHCVSIPWFDTHGNLINIKYRRTDNKKFFYEEDGLHIKYYVYGLDKVNLIKAKRISICESEIDALTLWTYGYPAVALGGSSLSEQQKALILNSTIDETVICTDNDKVGHRLRELLKKEFSGLLNVYDFKFPHGKKDINDLDKGEISVGMEKLIKYVPKFVS